MLQIMFNLFLSKNRQTKEKHKKNTYHTARACDLRISLFKIMFKHTHTHTCCVDVDEDEVSLILLLLELAFSSFLREAADVVDMIDAFGADDDIIVLGWCIGLTATVAVRGVAMWLLLALDAAFIALFLCMLLRSLLNSMPEWVGACWYGSWFTLLSEMSSI